MDDARWTIEQVAAIAPSPRSVATAEPLATDTRWAGLGSDDRALWGRCSGSGSEPYDTMVDHRDVAWRCSCPSRKLPCKHALALLLLWIRGGVPAAAAPAGVGAWTAARDRRADPPVVPGSTSDVAAETSGDHNDDHNDDHDGDDSDGGEPTPPPTDRDELDRSRDERVARMLEGLTELDRWLEDRMRTGLTDPRLARYDTWDDLAARLVDARAGAVANRVRRLAGLVGTGPDWHSEVLSELGMLHLIAQGGRRLPDLPGPLADAVATASGWQVRQADVLAGVPDTDDWFVAGRSDTREDRIEVRRVWLRGVASGEWAMVLSFAAYQQSLDDSFTVGTVVRADLHRYPGRSLRSLAGRREADPLPMYDPLPHTIRAACDAVGSAIADQPWLDRYPAIVRASPRLLDRRWVLGDETGSLPLLADHRSLATIVAASTGDLPTLTVEWTPRGVIPLTVHLADRVLDVGPRADTSFVAAS